MLVPSDTPNESTSLLRSDHNSNDTTSNINRYTGKFWLGLVAIAVVSLVGFHFGYQNYFVRYHDINGHVAGFINSTTATPEITLREQKFPIDFVWGVATSSYQIEGAVHEDERGPTIWDVFVQIPGHVLDGSTGDIADDHYHRYKDDIQLMKNLNIRAYRFSIAWSRILPSGRGPINMAGIQFYNDLIDELLRQNIQPWITLFHWDLPQALQDECNGWMDKRTVQYFVEYANIIFQHFSHKVKRFITINEPWTYSVIGHGSGIHAPGRKDHPSTEPYIVAHNFLLAHIKVAKLYKAQYAGLDGLIGISNCGDFRYPKVEYSERDQEAALRAMLFQWGWFVEPLVFGHYPVVMRERLGDRLPNFTIEEQNELIGSTDFFGLNYYSSLLASAPEEETTYSDYWSDIHVNFTDDPTWTKNAMGWNVVPDGLREMLRWISERYSNPLIYITENGSAEPEVEVSQIVVHDERRRSFLESHIGACADAINMHRVNLAGYFAWSFLDNFEWQYGYQRRFGICHVNFTTQQRTPRDSALWYRDHIKLHQQNDSTDHDNVSEGRHPHHRFHEKGRLLKISTNREPSANRIRPTKLPTKVLIGYGSDCNAVRRAVQDGVNIVVWSFIDVARIGIATDASVSNQFRTLILENEDLQSIYSISTTLNLTDVRSLIVDLYASGYGDVLHFASVGGWNGAHIDTKISPSQWYKVFTEIVGDVFDGIDWDLEGNDALSSPYNFFTLECLNQMGMISQLAKRDGKFVSIAPPQSYMNINSSRFSRYVNLTNPTTNRPAPYSTFTYYGSNVYAYLVQQYGDWIDLISIQFYESYSEASYNMWHDGYNASDYLLKYIDELSLNNESFYVNFTEDLEVGLAAQNVSLPLQKLVFGFGNGWASRNEKIVYISSDQINMAWQQLHAMTPSKLPRGFMFWTINAEGENGVFLAKDLFNILQS